MMFLDPLKPAHVFEEAFLGNVKAVVEEIIREKVREHCKETTQADGEPSHGFYSQN